MSFLRAHHRTRFAIALLAAAVVALPAAPSRGTVTTEKHLGVSSMAMVSRVKPVAPCGGLTPAKPGGGTYTCTFSDDFSGSTLDSSKWSAVTTASSGFHSGSECFFDSARNISVANGAVNLTVRKESAPFTCTSPLGSYTTQYSSGSISTIGKFDQAYGRFSIRAKFPAATVAGLQSSLWLWPTDMYRYGTPWPKSGEIDIAEAFSKYPDRAIPYVHYVYDPTTTDPATGVNVVTNNFCTLTSIASYHEYTVEWTPTSMRIVYDGKTCLVDNYSAAAPLTASQPFDQPFYVILTQALGIGTNAFDPATTPLPATTSVDYVRVWK